MTQRVVAAAQPGRSPDRSAPAARMNGLPVTPIADDVVARDAAASSAVVERRQRRRAERVRAGVVERRCPG